MRSCTVVKIVEGGQDAVTPVRLVRLTATSKKLLSSADLEAATTPVLPVGAPQLEPAHRWTVFSVKTLLPLCEMLRR